MQPRAANGQSSTSAKPGLGRPINVTSAKVLVDHAEGFSIGGLILGHRSFPHVSLLASELAVRNGEADSRLGRIGRESRHRPGPRQAAS
jgi:hypothetical protein